MPIQYALRTTLRSFYLNPIPPMEHNQENKLHCRVVLFPQSYTGHLVPMLNLGYALYSKGFSITIIHTRFNAPDPTKYSNFDFYFIEDVLSKDKTSSTGSLDTIRVLNETCLDPFKDCLSHIMEVSSKDGEPVACLVSDPMWVFAGVVADQLNLPRLVLRTGGLLAFVLYDSLPVLKDKGYFPIQETQKEEPLLEVPHLKVKDLPVEEHHNVLLNMVKETKNNCQGMICNTFKELEGSILDTIQSKMLATPIFLIGPLHKYSSTSSSSLVAQGQSSITWLNEQSPHSVLYVSFGTVAGISKEELLEVAFGIANSQQPFLWVIGPRLLNGSEKYEEFFPQYLLEILSKNGCIVEWAPQIEVLAHPAIGGFWTHCGWNSSIESICEGVPMICLPFFGDQMMNARYITDVLKIGLQLENGVLERNVIENSIGRLMVGKEGRDIRERICDLKAKAQRCLMEGESSYESLDRLTSYILSFCGLKL